ncbi:MAG: long-chain fatty acid--CoA ligase [Acetobacteraceae bacterium]|nr:long-chain fatty acid--CoA ligase [Acetobacteraceae bacterium]
MLGFGRSALSVAAGRADATSPGDSGADSSGASLTIPALFDRAVARYGARPAIDFLGRRWTYAQLADLVDRAASGLQDLGVGKGSMVGLCLPNTPYSVIFFFAVLKAGGTVVNYNPLYVERELKEQIVDSGTTIMVVPDLAEIHRKVAAVAAESGLNRIVVCPMAGILTPVRAALFALWHRKDRARFEKDSRHLTFSQVITRVPGPRPIAVSPQDVAVLQYTGGTTGTPKGATLTHANLIANCRQMVAHMPSIRMGKERVLGVLPLFHVFAMTTVMNLAVATGAEMVLLPRFVLRQVMRCIERRKITILPAVPTIYAAINEKSKQGAHDLTSITLCVSGGAPLPGDVRHRFETLTGCKLVEGYGLTEASPVVACNPTDGRVKDGSVGIAIPDTQIEIRDPAEPSRVLGPNQRGEVCVRGPQVMAGYWRRPAETRDVFVDGALRTGDIGYLDQEGYLFLVDRIKDVILCGAYNVYPRILEEALYQHPAVAEAVVVGVPDSYRGQAPKAFITLREGMTATPDELLAFLTGYVSKIELPREVEIRTSLPKTMIGKLSKKELVAEEYARARPHEDMR